MIHNTKKYDKSIHYKFETKEIFLNNNTLVLYKEPNIVMQSYRGIFPNNLHSLFIFFNDRYHNVVIMWEEDWTPYKFYVNIATPAIWNNTELNAIDLDIDLFRYPNKKEIIIDDMDEFELHKIKFNYPSELVNSCLDEVETVKKLMIDKNDLFSDTCFDWRPGLDLPFKV